VYKILWRISPLPLYKEGCIAEFLNSHIHTIRTPSNSSSVSSLQDVSLSTWGEWAIAMHGRYKSHILFISITCVYYIHTMILLYFSTIYFILDTIYEHKQVNHSSMSIVVCLFNTVVCDL
jgi:hypothetical protein